MKRKILTVALALICIAIAAGGTLAYYTAEDVAHNVITTGKVNVELREWTKAEGKAELQKFPEGGMTGVMPNTSRSKIVEVANTGTGDAWIRVSVMVDIQDQAGEALASYLTDEEGQPVLDENGKHIPLIEIDCDVKPDGAWLFDADTTRFYYKKPVKAGEVTSPLFNHVYFAKEMDNRYQNCTVTVQVRAEGVQTANNPIPEGGTVAGVKGWPNHK